MQTPPPVIRISVASNDVHPIVTCCKSRKYLLDTFAPGTIVGYLVHNRPCYLFALAGLIAIRVIAAIYIPLSFDEAYYWTWSQNLSLGYYDHPPMVALMIRIGTLIAGKTELGVRIVGLLLAIPTTWAILNTTNTLFQSVRFARCAALFMNLTLLVAGTFTIATPDTPLMVASAFAFLFLAKVVTTARPEWWLAVGGACGLALLSKYSALFLGVGIFLWLISTRTLRHWLISPWPYLGALIALALFFPVIIWNINHDFSSFMFQFGRIPFSHIEFGYLLELLPAQLMLATPPIFILATAGVTALRYLYPNHYTAIRLVGWMVWPIVVYCILHSLHQRAEGNWLLPIYPSLCIAAASSMAAPKTYSYWGRLVELSRRTAVPVAVGLLLLVVLHCSFGLIRLARDPIADKLGFAWPQLATQIDGLVSSNGAVGILTSDYHTTSWLSFYLQSKTVVVQENERVRWINMPRPSRVVFQGRILFVTFHPLDQPPVNQFYARTRLLASISMDPSTHNRARCYVYLLEDPTDSDAQYLMLIPPLSDR